MKARVKKLFKLAKGGSFAAFLLVWVLAVLVVVFSTYLIVMLFTWSAFFGSVVVVGTLFSWFWWVTK